MQQGRIAGKSTWIALALAGALGTAGCASRTAGGAVVGGVSGSVLGAGVGAGVGGNKGAVIGAGVGAAAGAGAGALIGRYMDKQQKELEQKLPSARIERQGDQLAVRFNSAILFDTDEAEVKNDAKKELADFAKVLKEYRDTNLVVAGHTDSTGSDEHNEKLSRRRAEAVVDFLAGQGVERGRLTPKGLGEEHPTASNASAEGRQQNRRVQIQIAANEELRRRSAKEGQSSAPSGGTTDQRATRARGNETTR